MGQAKSKMIQNDNISFMIFEIIQHIKNEKSEGCPYAPSWQ